MDFNCELNGLVVWVVNFFSVYSSQSCGCNDTNTEKKQQKIELKRDVGEEKPMAVKLAFLSLTISHPYRKCLL